MLGSSPGVLLPLGSEDLGFTGALDNALRWCIKTKAKCIDELHDVEAVQTRLDRIKDAVLQERNEAAAEAAMNAAHQDGDASASLGAESAEDEVIRGANPTQHAEHGEAYWQALSAQTVKTYIKLVAVDGQTQEGIAQSLAGSEVNKCKGQEQKNSVLVLLDVDLLCESMTRPSDKRPPLPEGVVHRLLRGCMQGRGVQKNRDDEYCQPLPGDVFALFDGKREHVHKDLLDAFTPSNKNSGMDASVRVFHLFVNELSLRARTTSLVRGSEPISQKQCMLAVSSQPLVPDAVPEKGHVRYAGTNRGDVIGLITLDPLDSAWQLPFESKKLLYGDRLVSTEQDKDAGSTWRDETMEPVFYHHLPCSFYENLVTTMSATAIIDLAAGPGSAAKSALVQKRPYWGLCLSEHHVTMLYRHLVYWVLSEMSTEGSSLYNPKYAECKGLAQKPTGGGGTPTPNPKPEPKPDPKPKPAGPKKDTIHKRRHGSPQSGSTNGEPHKRRRGSRGKARTAKAVSSSRSISGSD
jgi:hypothetical protein